MLRKLTSSEPAWQRTGMRVDARDASRAGPNLSQVCQPAAPLRALSVPGTSVDTAEEDGIRSLFTLQWDLLIADPDRPFAQHLRQVRQRLAGKQVWLSCGIGCTVPAVSQWESGVRLPNLDNMCRVLSFLKRNGASKLEILTLCGSWQREALERPRRFQPDSHQAPGASRRRPTARTRGHFG